MYPEMPAHLGGVVPYAELARVGGHRLWFGHSNVVDSLHAMAALAGRGYPLSFGSAVALYPLYHPHGFAVLARSVARLTGQTYVAGVGPGSALFQTQLLGEPLARPVTGAGQFVEDVKSVIPKPLSTGPADGPERVDRTFGSVETGLGVLRPAMARSAGRHAEWAITWLTPGSYIEEVLQPEMVAAARAASRAVPRTASVVHLAVRRPGRDPQQLAHAAVGAHLAAPHYTSMLQRAGVPAHPADPWAGAGAVVDAGIYLYGTAEEIVTAIEDMHERGVHEVVLNVFGVSKMHGAGQAVEDLEEVLHTLWDRRRRAAAPVPSAVAAPAAVVGALVPAGAGA